MHFTATKYINEKLFKLLLISVIALVSLNGCGGGADTEGKPNQDAGNGATTTYTGPVAATPDVQKFQDTVWRELSKQNRCGSCHKAGSQSPSFADSSDVNFAYSEALRIFNGAKVADLITPASSLMVTKVGLGHRCWLTTDSVCASQIEQLIKDWALPSGTSTKSIVLTAPELNPVVASKNFPDFINPTNVVNTSVNFETTIYPVLHEVNQGNCGRCHSDTAQTKQQPYFAQENVAAAYEAAKQKINLENTSQSRFVLRLCDVNQTNIPPLCEAHNCWSGDCDADARTMKDAIDAFAGNIDDEDTVDPTLVISRAMKLTDGIIAAGGQRHEANVVALWEFKSGTGLKAYDTSGISPTMDLDLTNTTWVGGYGIEIQDGGRAQAQTSDSKKLHDTIKATGQFSIEAWIVPNNVAQTNKNIISYSSGDNARNFTVKQFEYAYEAQLRTSETGTNGQLPLRTADEDAQPTQQHIVINYDQSNGREIFVNGVSTGDPDTTTPGTLSDWKDNFAFLLGNEAGAALTDFTKQWSGKFRMVAIHNRALTLNQIKQNFETGVGEKFFLLFSVSHLTNVPESYILLEVAEFDSYSYLFNKPTFVSLATDPGTIDIDVKGMRIGINGQEAIVGQTFINLDTNKITSSGQVLSSMGTVISQDKGVANDDFFLAFEQFGTNTKVYLPASVPTPAAPADLTPESDIGVRTFDEINATMSAMTGIATTNPAVTTTFNTIKQQLPSAESIEGFLSSHQVGIAQLAIEYCNALVDDDPARINFFGSFGFGSDVATAFNTAAGDSNEKNQIVDALYDKMVGIPATAGTAGLVNAPSRSQLKTELIDSGNALNLFDRLSGCPSACTGDATRTEKILKAMCASVTASAAMLIQ